MKKTIFLLIILTFFSCKKNEQTIIVKKELSNGSETITEADNETKTDTLKITYQDHKNLFDILTILPDSTMASWGWPKNDRLEFVKKIKLNNYATASREHFSRIELLQPNTIGIQVVDGYWILSIYKIKPNNYIVITDDIVGDGNDFHAFEYENGQLTNIPFRDLFDHFISALVIDPNDEKCMEIFDDNRILFEYSYIGTKKIKMSNSYLDENKDCFKGNTLNYEFNPLTRKFNLIKID